MMLLCCGQLQVVQLLVESGANVNHRDHLGVTALFWATGDIFKYMRVTVTNFNLDVLYVVAVPFWSLHCWLILLVLSEGCGSCN